MSAPPEPMRKVLVPGTDLEVSALCYGLAEFGTTVSGVAMDRLLDRFAEAGGTFFDTAHCYAFWVAGGLGASERALGAFLARASRERFVVATKGGHPAVLPDYPRPDGWLSPRVVGRDVEESLERLGISTIDLYYLHRDDGRLPVDEIVEMLNEFIAEGQVRHLGASNWRLARVAEANAYARSKGLQGFVAVQNQWSLAAPNWPVGPDPIVRYLTAADGTWFRAEGVLAAPYSSTATGYFATHGARGEAFDSADNRQRLARAEQLAGELGVTPNQVALSYLLCQDLPVVPVIGTRSLDHLDDAFGALSVALSPEQLRWLDQGERR